MKPKKDDLQTIIFKALEDIKAKDIVAFDTGKISSEFSRLVIATGTSSRHVCAIAAHVYEVVKALGLACAGNEGENTGNWVVVDAGDWVIHVMQTSARQYYRLEELWGKQMLKAKEVAAVKTPKNATNKTIEKTASKATGRVKNTSSKTTSTKTTAKLVAEKKNTSAVKAPRKSSTTTTLRKATAARKSVRKSV